MIKQKMLLTLLKMKMSQMILLIYNKNLMCLRKLFKMKKYKNNKERKKINKN
jgi:hypothetical protein